MRGTIRSFLLFEAATFLVAFLIHSGVLIAGYEHQKTRIAEGVIAFVLLTASVSTWIRPASTRTAGLAGQAFALLGTLIGVFTIRRWSTHDTRHCLPYCHRCRIDLGVGHYKVHVESLNFVSLSWLIFPSWYNRATALAIVL
jgi:hypothetical protein